MASSVETKLDLLWEVAEIAKLIGRTERQTFHLLSSGQLPAKKVGGRWVAERSKLIAFFVDDAA
ncbi:DNA-binding protein [Rhizobium rhizogenes]|uniref:DNA-binding protein n=1 Tax=Rhizobium rhizogenes TaxID=359 RepID=UPI0015731F18|nr:DNA-binding protein [Rhizobium rhizogenes]NTF80876.1 DNA-binding protein [Rhizobium rhizogenes]NTI74270.1 DNA-binding protein [Rhizobium rhizogenes]